jgi:hypothetical protein
MSTFLPELYRQSYPRCGKWGTRGFRPPSRATGLPPQSQFHELGEPAASRNPPDLPATWGGRDGRNGLPTCSAVSFCSFVIMLFRGPQAGTTTPCGRRRPL